jgi:hypothetical protein
MRDPLPLRITTEKETKAAWELYALDLGRAFSLGEEDHTAREAAKAAGWKVVFELKDGMVLAETQDGIQAIVKATCEPWAVLIGDF